ncbi:hypothetical protein [Thermophilibacter sp.]
MTVEKDAQMEGFTLGAPALVCRWRLAARTLPMENRLLRALSRRRANGAPVSPQLVAWAKQHIEWTLADGAAAHPDGVLMLIIDEEGRAAMTVGPYEPLAHPTTSLLAERACAAELEAARTGVAPETLWGVRGDALVWGRPADAAPSAIDTLVSDLARTVGMSVERDELLAHRALDGDARLDETFLASDEHGVVPSSTASGPRSARLAQGYARLLAAASAKRR